MTPAVEPAVAPAVEPAVAPAVTPNSAVAPEKHDAPSADATRIRAFIAINLPVAVVRRIADDVAALRGAAPAEAAASDVAWVPAANLHVTLKFLGMIRPESVEAIHGALSDALSTAGRAPFDLEARGMGAFPDVRDARVLWVGLRDQPLLVAVQQEVEKQLVALGFAAEERPFHPHITIGRARSGAASWEAPFAARAERSFGVGRVTEVVVYESRTHGRGSEYRALARIQLGLGGAAPVRSAPR